MVACLRHADLQPTLDPVTGAVRPHAQAATAAPAEWAALEIALLVAQAWGGRVLAVTAGPPDAETVLREALAVGAEALRVQWPSGHGAGGAGAGGAGAAYPAGMVHLDGEAYLAELAGDEQPLAVALAAAVRPMGPALVVCGDRSGDRGTGALPAFLAHELGAAQALGLVSLAADGDQLLTKRGLLAERQLLAERRLPAGRRERLRVPVPAVCSVEAAGIRLRRAPLPAVLAARTAVIPVVTAGPAAQPVRAGAPRPYSPRTHAVPGVPAGSARERLFALSAVLTQREPPVVVSPASADAAADALLGYLHRAGYALPVDPGTAAGPAFARNPALAWNPGPAAEPGPAADPDPAAGPGRKAGQP